MASYTELHTLAGTNALIEKIAVAITIGADTVLNEDIATANHTARLVWAKSAFQDPAAQAKPFLNALLAANNGLSTAAIEGASDAAIQVKVDAVIDVFAGV